MTTVALLAVLLAAPPAGPTFHATTTDGTSAGAFPSLAAGWGEKMISITRADRPRPPFPGGPQLILANADRIPGRITGGDDTGVRFAPDLTGDKAATAWRIPLASVRVAWVTPPPADTPIDSAGYRWLPAGRTKDMLLLRNGDSQPGDLARVAEDGKSLVWSPPGSIELNRVAAFATNPALVVNRKPKGPVARLLTVTGCRVTLATLASDGSRLTGTTTFGAKVDLPVESVVAVDVLQGKAVYLGDLKPTRAETVPFNRTAWPWTADRSAKGQPLQLVTVRGVETFDKGLGTHPRTTLTYDLAGKFQRFEAVVGLDAATGRLGSAACRVEVDGKPVPVPGLEAMTGGPSVAVSVPVTGAKVLTLVVDFGPTGDVQADVNWADARVW